MTHVSSDLVRSQHGQPHVSNLAHPANMLTDFIHRAAKRQRLSDDRSQLNSSSNAALVLFRHTAASAKKHTRPPISSLYSSIELLPEHFLQLQAVAKDFMLDEAHPERRDTVGTRGKGDSEVVKLRLYNCAKDFVVREGNGEKFFGRHVQSNKGGARSMIWPEDENKIITALIPLLRRVITNERQRQYALESRGKAQVNDDKSSDISSNASCLARQSIRSCNWERTDYKTGTLFDEFTHEDLASYNRWTEYRNSPAIVRFHTISGISRPGFDEVLAIIDHHLRFFHNDSNSNTVKCLKPCENSVVEGIVDSYPEIWEYGHWGVPEDDINLCDKSISVRILLHEMYQVLKVFTGHCPASEPSLPTLTALSSGSNQDENPAPVQDPTTIRPKHLSLRVTLLEGEEEDVFLSKHELSASDIPYLHTLIQKMGQRQSIPISKHSKIYVHLPDGLKLIEDDNRWVDAMEIAKSTTWFAGYVNVVIRVAPLKNGLTTP